MRALSLTLCLLLIVALGAPIGGIGSPTPAEHSQTAGHEGAGQRLDGPVPLGPVERSQNDERLAAATTAASAPAPVPLREHYAAAKQLCAAPPRPAATLFLAHCALLC